jgi:hypothetical protein
MSNFGLEITPRPDLPAIVARWQREITASELQAGYLAILAAADALGCSRWLLDLRRRDEVVSAEVNQWVEADFFPQLPGRYAAPVRIAFLISPLRAARQPEPSSVAAISAATRPEHGYHTKLFTEEAAAYQWLGA